MQEVGEGQLTPRHLDTHRSCSFFLGVALFAALGTWCCYWEDSRDEAVGYFRSELPRSELPVHVRLGHEEDRGCEQEWGGGEEDRVIAKGHHDHHVGDQGHEEAQCEEYSSCTEKSLLQP